MSSRRIILVTLAILAGVVIGIAPSVIQFFAERELVKLQQRGVRIQVESLSGFIVGISAKQVESWLPIGVRTAGVRTIPLQLQAEDVRVSAGFSPLALQLRVYAEAAIYGGSAQATFTNLVSAPKVEGAARGVDVSIHPQLRALGIESGIVEATITNHPLDGKWKDDASYTLSLDNLEILPPGWLQTMGGISQVRNGRAVLRATVRQGGQLSLQSSSFDCSLASGSLQGTAIITESGDLMNVNASIRVNLDRPDSDKIGRWLPIIAGSGIASNATSFVCAIRSTRCGATAGARSFANGCVTFTCAG
jgi:hypothetical protein